MKSLMPDGFYTTKLTPEVIQKIVHQPVPTHTTDGYEHYYLAIYHDNEVIGSMNFNYFRNNDGSIIIYLRQIDIVPPYSGKGLGKAFISYLIDEIKNNKYISAIELEAHDSKGFWTKCGFIPTGEISRDGDIRMRYNLRS